MACSRPLQAYYAKPKANGKKNIVFKPNLAIVGEDGVRMGLRLGCGSCDGCRLKRACHWALRCSHEASQYDDNCFITLTFSDKGFKLRAKEVMLANEKRLAKGKPLLPVPNRWTLDHRDFQLFMKRLRKRYGGNIRFFQAGEYGAKRSRPHYHAILFNFDFKDRRYFKTTKAGCKLYRSSSLEKLWPYGYSSVGTCTFESAGYVARYALKKKTGKRSDDYYTRMCRKTGEIYKMKPEYVTMSRRPGIGANWIAKFYKDVYPKDFITSNRRCVATGKPKVLNISPPRYYDSKYELIDPQGFQDVKMKRELEARKIADVSFERLRVRGIVKESKIRTLVRPLFYTENGIDSGVPPTLSEIFPDDSPPPGLYELEEFGRLFFKENSS